MGYIGAQPATNFETVRKQVSTTNSGTTITLDFAVSSVQDILVTVNAVVQSYDNYSVSGTTLTLGGTLNNDRVEILYVGRTFQTVTPAIGTVTNDMLSGSITASKLSSTAVDNTNTNSTLVTGQTAITSLADTDKFLVSDASDSGNLKYVEKQYLPSGTLVKIADANITSNVGSHFFSNVFSSTYDSYFLDLRKVRFASDAGLQLRFLSDSGTSEFSGTYYQFAFYGFDAVNNEERDFGNGDSKFVLGPATDADSSSDGGITGHMYFYNPFANNSSSVNAVGQFAYRDNSNIHNGISFSGNYSGTAPRYGFVLFGSQNINELRATLYGIVK